MFVAVRPARVTGESRKRCLLLILSTCKMIDGRDELMSILSNIKVRRITAVCSNVLHHFLRIEHQCCSFPCLRNQNVGSRASCATYPILWIEYSIKKNRIYCQSCRFFVYNSKSEDTFVKTGFNNWKKIGEKVKKHANSKTHKEAQERRTSMCEK